MNLWRPCQGAGCGGAHKPAVMRRAQFSDPADPRSNYSHLAYTDFPPANYIWQPQYDDIFANGDGQYVYPCEHAGAAGTGGPCATVRLAAIRDGLEDWELFARLGAKQAAPLLRRLVRSPTDWTEDAALLEATRREAAAMLDAQLAARTQKRRNAAVPAVPVPDAAGSAAAPAVPASDAVVPAPVAAGSGVAPQWRRRARAVPAPDYLSAVSAISVMSAPAAQAEEPPQTTEREGIQDPVERLRVNKERLVAFYLKVEPSRTREANIDRILIEYSLQQLADALTNKYGSAPLFVLR